MKKGRPTNWSAFFVLRICRLAQIRFALYFKRYFNCLPERCLIT